MIFYKHINKILNAVDGSYDNNWMECDIHLDIWILCVIHQYSPMPLDEAIYSALIRFLWSISEKLNVNFWIWAGVYTCMCVWTCTCLFYMHVCIHPGFSILLHGFHCENWLYSFDWYGVTYKEIVILYCSARINLSRQKIRHIWLYVLYYFHQAYLIGSWEPSLQRYFCWSPMHFHETRKIWIYLITICELSRANELI